MKYSKLSAMVLSALALPAFAVVVPQADQPGAAIPQISKPFITQLPSIGPKIQDTTTTKKPTASSQKKSSQFLVRKVEVLGLSEHSHLDSLEINKLAERLRLKLSDDTGKLSVPQLHQIAEYLTNYFRKSGYFLSRVYLPPQKLNSERIVRYRVREAYLGKVIIHGNKVYSKAQLEAPFNSLINKPVKASQIESALITINDYPGLRVKAIFKKGHKPGETNIDLQVVSSHRVNFSVGTDTYGTKTTGRYRATTSINLYNLTHGADDLDVTYMQKFTPTNSHYYQAAYSRQVIWPWTRFLVSYSFNDYALGGSLEGQSLGGESQVAKAEVQQYVYKSRHDKIGVNAGLTHDVGFLKQNSTMLNRDKLTISNLTYFMSSSFTNLHLFSFFQAQYDHGFNNFLDSMGKAPDGGIYPARQGANGEYAQGRFNKETIDFNLYQAPFAYQLITFTLHGQFSDDLLTSFSQMTFGGYSNMSAYGTNDFLADKGYTTSLMWEVPVPGLTNREFFSTKYKWGNLLHIGAFTEYGAGWNNDATGDNFRHFVTADYGLKLMFEIGHHLQLEGVAAKRYAGTAVPSDGENEHFWGGLTYSFNGF